MHLCEVWKYQRELVGTEKSLDLQKEKYRYPAAQTEHYGVVCGIARAMSAARTITAKVEMQNDERAVGSETASERVLRRTL